MLIARAASNGSRRMHFVTIVEKLTNLLKEFGPRRLTYHPEFPFWYLQTDGFWEVENKSTLALKKSGQSPTRQTLLAQDAVGAVPQHLWEALQHSAVLRAELTQQLLNEFWPPTRHDAIRQAIGLPEVVTHTVGAVLRGIRTPRFREEVLCAYERRCAICGYDGRLGDTPLGLEAAHIKWYAWHGPDQVDNGIALCAFHHIALDAGALGLSDDLHILISCDVNGQTMLDEFIHRFAGQRLRLPQSSYPPPARPYIAWHRKEVFRAPARTGREAHLPEMLHRAAEGQELYTPMKRE